MNRRTFNIVLATAAASSLVGCASAAGPGGRRRTLLYQSVGEQLTHWDVDVDNAALTPRASIRMPSNVQYVWPHPSRPYLYVSTSDAASGNAPNPGTVHRLCAVRVDASGALQMHGEPRALPQRPIHNSVDATGTYALTCYNNPSNVTVHRIQPRRHDRSAGAADKPDRRGHLRAPGAYHARQSAGGIHVHPHGRAVYVSNRANATVEFNGKRVFRGGENNIAVFSIDQSTGEPTAIQHADPQSFHVRTFSIDPSGRILVAASIVDMLVRDGNDTRLVPAALSVFRIGDDGTLRFVRKYDVDLGGKFQWWSGFVGLPAAG